MRSFLLVLMTCGLTLSFWSEAAVGLQRRYFYISPTGSDSNDCHQSSTPCATFQHAIELCEPGQYCEIAAAPGRYLQQINVIYHKIVSILGPLEPNGRCPDRRAVVFDGRFDGAAQAGALFFAEDHAVLAINCMTLEGIGPGMTGFRARQFAIGDMTEVDLRGVPGSLGIASTETSKVNVLSSSFSGAASRFALASDLSQITIGGEITLADDVAFDVAFVTAVSGSVITISASKVTGGARMSGASYQCANAFIHKNVVLPGNDTAYEGDDRCLAPRRHEAELLALRANLDSSRAELAVLRSSLDGSRAELASFLAEVRQRDRRQIAGIASLGVAVLIGAAVILYVQLSKRRQT